MLSFYFSGFVLGFLTLPLERQQLALLVSAGRKHRCRYSEALLPPGRNHAEDAFIIATPTVEKCRYSRFCPYALQCVWCQFGAKAGANLVPRRFRACFHGRHFDKEKAGQITIFDYPTCCCGWSRGLDLNQRPPGYERTRKCRQPSLCLPRFQKRQVECVCSMEILT